ncbi:ABC transporter permease [Promicromonospora panici]|uniref:ABC transporter permease n=1 Tax=Promicromonospora panici TaxID=2219658 RepID=UPI0030F4431C
MPTASVRFDSLPLTYCAATGERVETSLGRVAVSELVGGGTCSAVPLVEGPHVLLRLVLGTSTDQTRTTGVVSLPGAFVGAVFAGSPPLEVAGFQLLLLASILAVGGIRVAALGWRLGAPAHLPEGTAR